MEAEILKVAGTPRSTGSGTISTPLTFTGYLLCLSANHSQGRDNNQKEVRQFTRIFHLREPEVAAKVLGVGSRLLTAVLDFGDGGRRRGEEEDGGGGEEGEGEEALLGRHGRRVGLGELWRTSW